MHPLALDGVWKITAAVLLGVAFGVIFIRSKLAFRQTLVDQFSFKDNTFAITFFVSMAVGVPLYYFGKKYGMIHVNNQSYQVMGIVYGAMLTGIGVALCGHIPSTAIASLAAGRLYSIWIFLGMLMAFPLLRYAKPIIKDWVYNREATFNPEDWFPQNVVVYLIPITCIILALFLRLIQRTDVAPADGGGDAAKSASGKKDKAAKPGKE